MWVPTPGPPSACDSHVILRLTPSVTLNAAPADYYSGGQGFYQVMDKLRVEGLTQQQASFFALEDESWLILGMDTGLNDSDPLATFMGA